MVRSLYPGLIATLLACPTQADVLGAKVGVNYWAQSYEARVSKGGGKIDLDSSFDIDDENDFQVYVALEHPIPLIPNLLAQHTKSSTGGDGVITATIFDRQELEGGVAGKLDMTHRDVTAYYELLDNQIAFDLGLSIRVFDGSVLLVDEDGDQGELELDDVVPLVYFAGRFDLPATNWHVQADGNYISFDGDKVIDVKAALGWESVLGFGAELGYRYMDIDYNLGGGLLEATGEGPYLGIYWDF